jgi:ParB family chromosome partitioning protein
VPEYRVVRLEQLVEPELVAREFMDEEKLYELRDSIRAIGLIQPLAVVQVGPKPAPPYGDTPEEQKRAAEDARVLFEIVAGHRRFYACRMIPLVEIPVLVYPSKDLALEAVKLHENLCREDLSPAEEAIFVEELIEKYDLTEDQLVRTLHKSAEWIEQRRALLRGDSEVFEALRLRKISVGHARELNKCADETHRRYLLSIAVASGITIAALRSMVQQHKLEQLPQPAGNGNGDPAVPGYAPPPNTLKCAVCGGEKDPQNLELIYVHRWELEGFRRVMDRAFGAARVE